MLSVVFGYNGATLLLPYLASGCCNYACVAVRKVSINHNLTDIERFVEEKDTTQYITLVNDLRIPNMDSPGIRNGIAYTCVGLEFINPKSKYFKWFYLRNNIDSLRKLRKYKEVPSELIDYMEESIWKNLGPFRNNIVHIVNKLVLHMSLSVAEKMYHPDYVWRTGRNQGKKTINVLLESCGLPPV